MRLMFRAREKQAESLNTALQFLQGDHLALTSRRPVSWFGTKVGVKEFWNLPSSYSGCGSVSNI
jgi:hypothetical protein